MDILAESFLEYINKNKKIFYPSIYKNYKKNPELFSELGNLMLNWATAYLEKETNNVLTDGYSYFVLDVNKSQMNYEKNGAYVNKSYKEVYDSTYDNKEHMLKYHWGVYATTFTWAHHLLIYKFFKDFYISLFDDSKIHLLELGSGSGIWGMILMNIMQNAQISGVDISKVSVGLSREMSQKNGFGNRCTYIVDDALSFKSDTKYDGAISCFLLEHLETPEQLLNNLCENIISGGYAFVTCALTAAEIDHIYEFQRESEVIGMAENAGFRVIASFSSAPDHYIKENKFLPRSMALVLQKRHNEIW